MVRDGGPEMRVPAPRGTRVGRLCCLGPHCLTPTHPWRKYRNPAGTQGQAVGRSGQPGWWGVGWSWGAGGVSFVPLGFSLQRRLSDEMTRRD